MPTPLTDVCFAAEGPKLPLPLPLLVLVTAAATGIAPKSAQPAAAADGLDKAAAEDAYSDDDDWAVAAPSVRPTFDVFRVVVLSGAAPLAPDVFRACALVDGSACAASGAEWPLPPLPLPPKGFPPEAGTAAGLGVPPPNIPLKRPRSAATADDAAPPAACLSPPPSSSSAGGAGSLGSSNAAPKGLAEVATGAAADEGAAEVVRRGGTAGAAVEPPFQDADSPAAPAPLATAAAERPAAGEKGGAEGAGGIAAASSAGLHPPAPAAAPPAPLLVLGGTLPLALPLLLASPDCGRGAARGAVPAAELLSATAVAIVVRSSAFPPSLDSRANLMQRSMWCTASPAAALSFTRPTSWTTYGSKAFVHAKLSFASCVSYCITRSSTVFMCADASSKACSKRPTCSSVRACVKVATRSK